MRFPSCLIAAGAVAALAAAAAGAAGPALQSPVFSKLAYSGAIHATTTTPRAGWTLARSSYWGGTYTASTGDLVTVYASTAYPQDDAVAQRWADFLAKLVHGSELSKITLFLQPSDEIAQTCGTEALACYSPANSLLIAPGDDVLDGPTAESIVAHEYGHHIAAHRANNPWPAIDWGTKRWATYERICSRTAAGTVYPGAEDNNYSYNPGEAFAETYRVLNEQRLGLPPTAWDIVDRSFYPDAAALAAVDQDVLSPWTGTTTSRLAATGKTKTFTIATPLDGTIRAKTSGRFTVELLDGAGKRLARGASSATTTICGSRTMRVRVTRTGPGTAPATLTVSRP